MVNTLYFSVKSGIKSIVGKDLIIDDNIAIFELVKNSYDAHAKKVIITFEKNKVIIADNGKGMSLEDVKNKWLALAYSAKKDGSEDNEGENDDIEKRISYRDEIQDKRFYAGAKGIGRFSSDRIGSKLKLITKKINSSSTEVVDINWKDFDKDDKKDFITVPVKHTSTTNNSYFFPDNKNHGTILEISDSSTWNRKKIVDLKHSLEKLINPFSETENFVIEIVSSKDLEEDNTISQVTKEHKYIERDRVNGPVKNSILDILKLKTTEISLVVDSENILTKITDRGSLIYEIREKNKYNPFIDNLKINLYFLNFSAKSNFSKKMGIQPVNYGSVFLFKNGFRVQPYGNKGDDSWGLDYRAQQGYNRYLGTRDLFGRVDITTSDINQFKEVSSRDGGLVETAGFNQLKEIFEKKAHRRLERYVAGVLWGEAFLKKKYFTSNNEGQKLREALLESDKNSENYDIAKSNIGSKIDFIQLLKSLTNEKEIEIIDYNKDLVNLVNENLSEVQPKFLKDLEKIAENLNDESLKKTYDLTEEHFRKLENEKDAAEKREEEERKKRIEAEKLAEIEREKREEAEKKQKEEEEKRTKAELETLKKEKERVEAELAKIKAEQKAKEEAEKNKKLEDKLSIETKKNQYLNATRKTLSEDAEQLVHSIDLYVGNASTYTNELLTSNLDNNTINKLYSIKNNIDKAIKVSQIIIKSNFDYKHTKQRVNLAIYIKEYIEDLNLSRPNLSFIIEGVFDKYYLINPIEIDIVLDNLVSNSIKAKANKILIVFEKLNEKTVINYYDDGSGITEKLVQNSESIFDLGVRDSSERGSGIGMYDVKKRIQNLKGDIVFLGNNLKLKGAAFQITL
jgi:signal transduction histidine kinase